MPQKCRNRQDPFPDLFEQPEPHIALTKAQRTELSALVTILLQEIAASLANGEASDDKDHG